MSFQANAYADLTNSAISHVRLALAAGAVKRGPRRWPLPVGPASPGGESLADYWLRKALEAELPILRRSAASDLEKVGALTSWVCRSVARAPRDSPCQLSASNNAGWDRRPVAQLLHLFARRRAAAMCGGTAQILLKVCRLFGFDGFVYGFGKPDSNLTHVVTVVRVEHDARTILLVNDAHFNISITDADGAPIDFLDLLRRLRQGCYSELRLAQDRDAEHDYLLSPEAETMGDGKVSTPNGRVRRKVPKLEKWVASKPMDTLFPVLEFPANFLALFTCPVFVGLARAPAVRLRNRLRSLLITRETRPATTPARVLDNEDCDAAAYWFRRYLEARYPVLTDRDATDVDKVHTLREFVFHSINRSPQHSYLQLPDRWGNDFYCRSAPELFRAFLNHEGSAMCNGNAYALTRVCELFGMPGFVYNMGIPEMQFTHAVAVITVTEQAAKRAIVADAHLGMTVEDENGVPVDFFDMLARLRDRQHERLQMRFQQGLTVPYIVPKGYRLSEGEVTEDYPARDLGKGFRLYWQMASAALEYWCRGCDMPRLMREHGFPPFFLYLYCFPQGVFAAGGSETEDARSIRRRIQAILRGEAIDAPSV